MFKIKKIDLDKNRIRRFYTILAVASSCESLYTRQGFLVPVATTKFLLDKHQVFPMSTNGGTMSTKDQCKIHHTGQLLSLKEKTMKSIDIGTTTNRIQ